MADGNFALETETGLKDTLEIALKSRLSLGVRLGMGKEGSAPEGFVRLKLGTMRCRRLRAHQHLRRDLSQKPRRMLVRFPLG